MPYLPKSKAPFTLDTLIPRNMAFEAQKALNQVVKQHGNIDHFVRNHLKYTTTEAMWGGLAAEQVDALGLYLHQFDREQGIIIADQTGIGKGRQAAAIIRHAILNNYLPVFFTRKPDLFTDMYRDLKAIDFADIHPFIINTDPEARIKDQDGHVVFSPLNSTRQHELIVREEKIPTDSPEAIAWYKKIGKLMPDPEKHPETVISHSIDYLPEEYDCIFSTYSQVQAAHPYKRLWLERVVHAGVPDSKKYKKVVFILDESHMAGGFESIIGKWMREVLPATKACCFLSATFAKYPEVMPFYAKKTAIQETGMDDSTFVMAMQGGGLALQEIVASNLAESGQLIRRQRSNEGIKVAYLTLDQEPARSKNRERVDRITALMNQVVEFEQEYITPILTGIHVSAKAQGAQMKQKPKSLGVKQAPYFSRVFNIIDQLLFALKVEEVAKKTLALLNEDKKVVIAFKSTMGAFLKDLNLVSGDIISPGQLDFTRTLVKGLDSIFYYSFTDITGNKSREKINLGDLPPAGVMRYEELRKAMLSESTGLTISPIDQLIALIEKAPKGKHLGGHSGEYFTVAEVTGRNQRVDFREGEATIRSFRSDTEKSFRLFNSGKYDVLLINQSGSTGSSAHASKDFADQRPRAMIIHQFELDINTEIQKRGRINRTGQVKLPEYYYITSDIPTEQRLMFMLKSKLKSLDANTTGSQKTSDDSLKSIDFLNKYGDKVAWQWVDEHPELKEKMGWPTYHKKTDKEGTYMERNAGKEGAIRQVTGRAGLLTVAEQETLYDDLLKKYQYQVKWEKQRGTYDLETEFLPLEADVKKRFLYQRGQGTLTPFGKDTIREVSIVNNLKRPFTKDEIDGLIDSALEGSPPTEVQSALTQRLEEEYPALIAQRKAKREEVIDKLNRELTQMPDPSTGKDEKQRDKLSRQLEQMRMLIATKTKHLENYLDELEKISEHIGKAIRYFTIGEVVKVPFPGSMDVSFGIFLGVQIGQSDNPWTLGNVSLRFAVADARKMVEYNLSPQQRSEIGSIFTESMDIPEEDILSVTTQWNELVKEASHSREKRHILTENIVGASDMIDAKNKLIRYNTTSGIIQNGILLDRDFSKEGEEATALFPISESYALLKGLPIDQVFGDHQNRIRLKKTDPSTFTVYITKKENFAVYTDRKLRELIRRANGQSTDELADFIQNAGDMTATVSSEHLEAFLKRLDDFNLRYYGEAKEITGEVPENAPEIHRDENRQTYRYKLTRPYGQGSNPTTHFINYQEPGPDHLFGVVEYDRPLTDKEKYNFSLVPVFNNIEEPYRAWKAYITASGLNSDFETLISEQLEAPLHQAIRHLGTFITNHPHEDGNPEFVFGEYTPGQLGRVAYEDMIGPVADIDELIAQLILETQPLVESHY